MICMLFNAYHNLHQGSDESTSAYLHRAQDISECIQNTCDMTSIPAIGTNHAKILTGLPDSRLQQTGRIQDEEMDYHVSSPAGHCRYGH